MIVRVSFTSFLPHQKKGAPCRKELTVVPPPPPPPLTLGRDALLEVAAFLNPETIFDVTSDARFIAAETVGGTVARDPSD
jgi:hypothetical protein